MGGHEAPPLQNLHKLVDDVLQSARCWSDNAGTFGAVLEEEERWHGLDVELDGDLGLLFDVKFGEVQSAFVFYTQLLVQRGQIMAVSTTTGTMECTCSSELEVKPQK